MENGNGVSYKKPRPRICMEYMDESSRIEKEDKKNKKVIIDNDSFGLHVIIVRAVGIDNPCKYPFGGSRHYNVVYWVEPGEEFRTFMAQGMCPVWNQKSMIFLHNLDNCTFLHVEVQKFNSIEDPGSSTGRVIVGRARIPFPKVFYREVVGAFSLVRSDGESYKPEGHIILAMRLERVSNSLCW